MSRNITRVKSGQRINYFGRDVIVEDVYPHIVYVRDCQTAERSCLNLGSLVAAGIEPPQEEYVRPHSDRFKAVKERAARRKARAQAAK